MHQVWIKSILRFFCEPFPKNKRMDFFFQTGGGQGHPLSPYFLVCNSGILHIIESILFSFFGGGAPKVWKKFILVLPNSNQPTA